MDFNHNFNLGLDKVKTHVKNHQKAYWMGSIVVVAGITYVVTRRFGTSQISVAPVFNNMPVFNNTVNNGGRLCKIVMDVETEEMWKKIGVLAEKLAKEHNVSIDTITHVLSKHLNGYPGYETVYGRQYAIAGLSTV
jgi:hypothetical protein